MARGTGKKPRNFLKLDMRVQCKPLSQKRDSCALPQGRRKEIIGGSEAESSALLAKLWMRHCVGGMKLTPQPIMLGAKDIMRPIREVHKYNSLLGAFRYLYER